MLVTVTIEFDYFSIYELVQQKKWSLTRALGGRSMAIEF